MNYDICREFTAICRNCQVTNPDFRHSGEGRNPVLFFLTAKTQRIQRTVETAALSKNRGAVVPVPLHWEAWDQKAKEES